MKLIAIHTIRRGTYSTALKISRREQFLPGDEFEAPEREASALVESGVAKIKTREVIDDDAPPVPRRSRRRPGANVGSPPAIDVLDGGEGDADDPEEGEEIDDPDGQDD